LAQRYFMQLAYDGTLFHGWQKQNDRRTIQQELEAALTKICKEPIALTAAGRTDAGVHAYSQYAHFDFPIQMKPEQIQAAIQSSITNDIKILKILPVFENSHARYDAIKRTYLYRLTTDFSPFNRNYCSFCPNVHLRKDIIMSCLSYFEGKHDFSAFSKHNPDINNNVCDVIFFTCKIKENEYEFTISANRFLHNMVRRIIGTIMMISHHKANPAVVKAIFKHNLQQNLIFTAPPNGLYLSDINYKDGTFR